MPKRKTVEPKVPAEPKAPSASGAKAPRGIVKAAPDQYQGVLHSLCKAFAAKREEKDRMEAELTILSKELNAQSEELVDLFGKAGITSCKMEGLGLFHLAVTARPKIIDQEALFKDMRKAGAGDVIKLTVNMQTLGALVRERRDAKKPDFKGIEIFEQASVRLRKS